MRKIATLALASALSIAALAPAAFANNPNCNGVKDFAPAMKTVAQERNEDGTKAYKGKDKITEAYERCSYVPPTTGGGFTFRP